MIERAASGGFLIALDEVVSGTLAGIAWGSGLEPPDVDRVTFPDGGGDSLLGLAIPRLADMDEVAVDEASLTVHALANPVAVDAPHIETGGGASTLDLGKPGRLVSLDVTLSSALPDDGHILVSAETAGVRTPMFAAPGLAPDLALYPAALTGMTASGRSGAVRLTFDEPVAGTRWAVTVAHGASAAKLESLAGVTATVTGAVVDASPTDLVVTIPGDPETTLLSTPGPMLPGGAPHRIDFAPLAQRHLEAALTTPPRDADPSVLAVPVKLHASTAGRLGIVARTLLASYRVRVAPPAPLVTGSDWAPLDLVVPAGRRPRKGVITFAARLDGMQLDPAFGPPPATPPAGGLVVAPRMRVSAPTAATPDGSGAATLVAVELHLEATAPAELVLELRADTAGLPGAVLATAIRRLPASPRGWQRFALATPLVLPAPALVWCTLRTNNAPVRWFAGTGGAPALLSDDDAATWRAPELPLGPGASPLIQLLCPEPGGKPRLDVYRDRVPVASLELARTGDREAAGDLTLPESILDVLGKAPGTGRVTTTLALWSPTSMSLTVGDGACTYDPAA